jgi:hypothetical protein
MLRGDVLRRAFERLRALPDEVFLKHPKDPKMYKMVESLIDIEGPWKVFAELFDVLCDEADKRLATLPVDVSREKLLAAHDRREFKMRLLRYLPVSESEFEENVQVRAQAHTDYGTFSLVFADGPGLEVETKTGWTPVNATETTPAHLFGDSMRLFTRVEEPSVATRHRVVARAFETTETPRHSIVLFVEPNGDYTIESESNETVQSYLKKRSGDGITKPHESL